MRWTLNLLLMFLLAGSLSAQCNILNLTATVFGCSDSQFFVTLDFEEQNASLQGFSVQLNGIPLGNYQYQNLPDTLGPFPAVAGVDYQLVVSDLGTPTCTASVLLDLTSCPGLSCDDIVNLTATPGNCNPDSTYSLTLNFDAPSILPDLSFVVTTESGDSLGTFQVSDLPLTISNYPNGNAGVGSDSVTICLVGLLNCCATTGFTPPNCDNDSCSISNLAVQVGDCNPDGSYKISVDFDYDNNTSDSTFTVFGNANNNLGTFALTSLPLNIASFPGGNPTGEVRVCIGNGTSCCANVNFQAPNCPPDTSASDCSIFKIRVQVDTCTSANTYRVKINFKVTDPDANTFTVIANGTQNMGSFSIDSLPITIDNYPYDGGTTDRITINIGNNCSATRKFRVPDCLANVPCDIYDLVLVNGDCTSDSTYNLLVDFNSKAADADSVTITIDSVNIGTFFPDTGGIQLTNIPWNGGNVAQINVCYSNNCCETLNFAVPGCLPGVSCEIFDVRVQTGDCNDDSTAYDIKLNFKVANADADSFTVTGNNGDVNLGTFPLTALPLTIADFPYEGGPTDNIRICLSNDCCIDRKFTIPACAQTDECQIYDVRVRTGSCNPDGTYRVRVNLKTQSLTSDSFNITAGNGQVFGPFAFNAQPAIITNFPASGNAQDQITICADDSTGSCCQTKSFNAPNCSGTNNCDISGLVVDPGACNPDGSYSLLLNFNVTNVDTTAQFEVTSGGQSFGTFGLGDLPLTISNFPNDNANVAVVKICIVGQPNCCESVNFQQPDCPTDTSLCDIIDLVATPGACNDDNTYGLTLNFGLQTPSLGLDFLLIGNGDTLGTYSTADLPLTIDSFPAGNNNSGVLQVCLVDLPNCCAIVEFQQPDCDTTNVGNCLIDGLAVTPGLCNPDGSFDITINFSVEGNLTHDSVDVYGNDGSVFFGTYAANSSPLNIHNYPSTSGSTPTVKVCASDDSDCCATQEFQAPDCPNLDSCAIFNLQVLATPCISGQFFAIVTVDFQGGSDDGFTIGGNGEVYGSFPYDEVQPIIIGPLQGDGTTNYEFVVQDNVDQLCSASDSLGIVDCQQIDPRSGAAFDAARSIAMSPNPVSDWLTVSAILPTATTNGQAMVQVFGADGRLVRSLTVADARAFNLDVSGLQPGLYRLSVLTTAGRLNGTFAKQ